MAHRQQFEFLQYLQQILPEYFRNKRVLEIGSLDINSTELGVSPRSLFENASYVGIDVGPGRGVDIVCEGQKYDAPDKSFDVVLSCEVMEHNPYWVETFNNMVRMCSDDGIVIMTCATWGRKVHGVSECDPASSPITTELNWNYYKNLVHNDFVKANVLGLFSEYRFFYNWQSYDLYFVGFLGRGRVWSSALDKLARTYRKRNYCHFGGLFNFMKALVRK